MLDSILAQKTTFLYELIIHDDASSDGTTNIVKDYAKKYPQIVRPIFQTQNQYSRGVDVLIDIMMPLVRGKYVAFCEGDDYWTDEWKLQKQVEFLEQHSNYSAYVHNTVCEDMKSGIKMLLNPYEKEKQSLSIERILEWPYKPCFHANSIVLRRSVMDNVLPTSKYGFGDFVIGVQAALAGKIYYDNYCGSVYRKNVNNSWTDRLKKNRKARYVHFRKVAQFYIDINRETKGRYFKVIFPLLKRTYYEIWKLAKEDLLKMIAS